MRGNDEKRSWVREAGASCGQGGFDFGADQGHAQIIEQGVTTAAFDEAIGTGTAGGTGLESAGQEKVKCLNCQHIDIKKYPIHAGMGLGMCRRKAEVGLFMSYLRERECISFQEN